MKILAVVPARGGSKGIKNKNVVELNGRPLVEYTLQALRDSRYEIDHIVSTDSEEIAQVAKSLGGNVPFLREENLATDKSNVLDAVLDVLSRVNGVYTHILLLQPTCPLRSSVDIDGCIDLLIEKETENVCSFTKVESGHLNYMYRRDGDVMVPMINGKTGSPRQAYEEVYLRNGAVYLIKVEALLRNRSFVTNQCVPYVMPVERSVNIDTLDDLELADYYLNKNAREVVGIGA